MEIGLSAQEVKAVMPELTCLAPFDIERTPTGEIISKSGNNYLTVNYERLVPVLVEAIKELKNELNIIKNELIELKLR